MDRDTLINVARTSLRTKLHSELADLLTEVIFFHIFFDGAIFTSQQKSTGSKRGYSVCIGLAQHRIKFKMKARFGMRTIFKVL